MSDDTSNLVQQIYDVLQATIVPELTAIRATLARHDQRFDEILGHIEALYARFERLEQEYIALSQAVRRIERRLEAEGDERRRLVEEVQEIKANIVDLQKRVEQIELELRQPS